MKKGIMATSSRKNKQKIGGYFRSVKMGGGGSLVAATLLASILFGGNAFAATYNVGIGQSATGGYETLEELRFALGGTTTANGNLGSNDTIILHNDDNSLTWGFTIAGGTAGGTVTFDTLGVERSISADFGTNARNFLSITAGTGTMTIDLTNINVTFSGSTNGGSSGTVINAQSTPLTIIGDMTVSGSGNRGLNPGNHPGAVLAGRGITFKGDVVFDNNMGGSCSALSTGWSGTPANPTPVVFDGTATFTNNLVIRSGGDFLSGTLSLMYNAKATFNDVAIFDNNRSTMPIWPGYGIQGAGAGIYMTGGIATFNEYAKFTNNKSWSSKGADDPGIIWSGNTFGGAIAGFALGTLYGSASMGVDPTFVFTNGALFENNSAFSTGFFRQGGVDIPGFGYGGATALCLGELDMTAGNGQNTFKGNQANGWGGAIFGEVSEVSLSGKTVFANNEAVLGGAICLANKAILTKPYMRGTDAMYDGEGNTLNLNLANAGDTMVFTNNMAGVVFDVSALDIMNAPEIGPVIDRTNAFGNDLWLYGTTTTVDTVAGSSISMDGGIRSYAFNNVDATLTKTGNGALMMIGNSWSAVDGTTAINGGTFFLGQNALWGKGAETTTNRNAALLENGVGTFYAGPDATLAFEFNHGAVGGQWGDGHSVIFANDITIHDDAKVSLVYYDASTGNYENASQDADNVQWQEGVVYDLAVASNSMSVTTGLYRGDYGPGDDQFFRDLLYDRDASGNVILNATGLSYGIEMLKIDEVIGTDPPYVDPSLKNRILSRRLDRCCKPIFCCPTDCDTGCDESITCQGIYSSCFQTSVRPKWNAWIEGYGTGGGVGNYKGKNGFDYSTGGMLVGIEKETVSNHRLGFYYGYGSSWTTGRSISYNGRSENTFGGYLRLADQSGYTLLMGNLGHTDYRSSRFIKTALGRETFNANFGANTSGAYLERGFDWRLDSHTCLTPFVAIQYSNLYTNWYDETTANGDIQLAQTAKLRYESLRSLIGARTQTMLRNRLMWNNWGHWEHELLADGAVVRDEYLTINPDFNARTVGNYGGRDWVVLGTGLEFAVTSNLSLNAGYDLSFNKHATFHTGMGGMTYTF